MIATYFIQNDLNKLEHMINETQSLHLAIANKKISLNIRSYNVFSQQLKQATSTKYLGVTIDNHLTWKDHINEINSKANLPKTFLKWKYTNGLQQSSQTVINLLSTLFLS